MCYDSKTNKDDDETVYDRDNLTYVSAEYDSESESEKETQQEEGAFGGLECAVVSTIYDSDGRMLDDSQASGAKSWWYTSIQHTIQCM